MRTSGLYGFQIRRSNHSSSLGHAASQMPETMARLIQLCTLHCGVPICLYYQNRKDERKRTRKIKRKRRYLKWDGKTIHRTESQGEVGAMVLRNPLQSAWIMRSHESSAKTTFPEPLSHRLSRDLPPSVTRKNWGRRRIQHDDDHGARWKLADLYVLNVFTKIASWLLVLLKCTF